MNKYLALIGSVVVLSALGLTACDSATATNEKKVAEVAKQAAETVAEAPKAAVNAVAEAAPKVKAAASEVSSDVKTAAVEATAEVKAVASDMTAAAVETAKEAKTVVTEAATDVKDAAVEVAADVKAAAVETSEEVADAVTTEPVAAAAVATPATSTKYKEGQHYFEIFPAMQTDAVGGKVEVVELLWLGCPHCFALEPTIKEYKKNLPDYIDFKQIPAMLNPRWAADARTFYIADILDPKGTKKLVDKVFNAIHVQKRARMSAPDVVKRFMLEQGITEDQYENAANSMVLQAKLSRGRQVSADSQAQSVPTLIINGRYRTSPYAAGNEKNMVEIVNMLSKREFDRK